MKKAKKIPQTRGCPRKVKSIAACLGKTDNRLKIIGENILRSMQLCCDTISPKFSYRLIIPFLPRFCNNTFAQNFQRLFEQFAQLNAAKKFHSVCLGNEKLIPLPVKFRKRQPCFAEPNIMMFSRDLSGMAIAETHAIFIASPGRNIKTHVVSAVTRFLPVSIIYHAVPNV